MTAPPAREASPAEVGGLDVRVYGLVQGVGFRPAVWRLARRFGLRGSVANAGEGVRIRVWGSAPALAAFLRALRVDAPPLARIDRVTQTPLDGRPPSPGFVIGASRKGRARTFVLPDVAVCPACVAETFDPRRRRHRYPFTNCTRCGPRFSIVRRLPYDRAHTSMAGFGLCRACRAEYADPADRRFHAQPIACPRCGPRIWLSPGGEAGSAAIDRAVEQLRRGRVVAVKGLGGFQLLADATRADAVTALRARKHRPAKPFALMARDLDVVRRYCRLTPAEEAALTSAAAPIVLLDAAGPGRLPAAVAPGLGRLGFVLPYTPLHHLLLRTFATPLVFTSGNPHGAPLCADNDEALQQLAGMADGFLLHDRAIVHRCDDSVVQRQAGAIRTLRWARGYAPAPLPLPPGLERAAGILALGGEGKGGFCLLREGQAVLSQYLGDLEDARGLAWYRRELAAFQDLFGFRPRHLAVDLHPEYLATKLGHGWAAEAGLRLSGVQHHHAHLAAVLAEYGHPLDGGPVLGLVLDGLGYGADGTFWGGELLWADYAACRRLARLQPAPLPGGSRAMTEPWRNLAARLWQAGMPMTAFPGLGEKPLPALLRLLETGTGSPPASSCGRLFDAVAAALGICFDAQTYEGEAAARLEHLAWQDDGDVGYPFAVEAGAPWVLNPAPLWPALLADLAGGVPGGAVARRFHLGLAAAWGRLVVHFAGKLASPAVVLSGGVFQNRLLLEALAARLAGAGLRVWMPRRVPGNDQGLALGQAVVAAARERKGR